MLGDAAIHVDGDGRMGTGEKVMWQASSWSALAFGFRRNSALTLLAT